MDQILTHLLSGDLNVEMLLIIIILAFIFRRIVPWWVYEETLEELKKYEEDAPDLLDAVQELTDEVRSQGIRSSKLEEVERRNNTIRRRGRHDPYTSARRRGRDDE